MHHEKCVMYKYSNHCSHEAFVFYFLCYFLFVTLLTAKLLRSGKQNQKKSIFVLFFSHLFVTLGTLTKVINYLNNKTIWKSKN